MRLVIAACMLGLALASTRALGAYWSVGIGDDCNAILVKGCFSNAYLVIDPGDTVNFYTYADTVPSGPHNVVADDGSFRCARGCDGQGGDGSPADHTSQWSFTRKFDKPGTVSYHDEGGGATGVIIVRGPVPFTIGRGITGSWFDPAQPGQGIMLQVLPGQRLLVAWLTFDPDGNPAWLLGVGTYSGDTATVASVDQPSGGRWIPGFDPASVVRRDWGSLSFTFDDCNYGRVDFTRTGSKAGSMNLRRLTQPAGASCP